MCAKSWGRIVKTMLVLSLSAAVSIGCAQRRSSEAMLSAAPSPPPPPAPAAAAATEMAKEADGKQKNERPTTWKRSPLAANSSRLMVGEHESLPLESMQAKVQIDGFRARVVIDYVYANERNAAYEGTFQLRLPQEATPFFFAFGENTFEARGGTSPLIMASSEVKKMSAEPERILQGRVERWTAPKEARMVPREKAAFAYQSVVRQRVDPALLEWASAGVFSARVFPLTPKKRQRIVIGYDVDLVRIGNDLEHRFELPANAPPTAVDVSVQTAGKVQVDAVPADGLTGSEQGVRYFRFDRPQADSIVLRLHGISAPLLVGSDAKAGDFFAAQVEPVIPTAGIPGGSESAVFLLDTSLSQNPDRFNVWLKLMRAVLEQNRASIKHFNVLFFSVDARWYRPDFVENSASEVDALLRYADTLALEGATDIGVALGEAVRARGSNGADGKHRPDLFLLSDGAATWGEGNLHALSRVLSTRGSGRLFGYQTGLAGTDVDALQRLARETGGGVFSVTGEAEIAKVAVAHRSAAWRLLEAKVAGASDVLVAGRPSSVYPGQTLLVAGRGTPKPNATLELVIERNGTTKTITAPLASAISSTLAPRAYGQIATTQLEELTPASEKLAKAYATHFRVTGQTCSLLMLESEQDYQRFGIRPDEDAYAVRSTPAGAFYASTLKETYETLGDPKASFISLLRRLEKTPGVRFEIPVSYEQAVRQMPASAFAVDSVALTTVLHERAKVSPSLLTALEKHTLDYDTLSSEALARAKRYGPGDALKALSSLVEESPGDSVLARDIGFSAMDLEQRAQAFHLFRRVADQRPHEPQTYRAMAQALAALGKNDLAIAYYEIPLIGQWDARFGDLQSIVELEYLRFLRRVVESRAETSVPDYAKARLATLSAKVGLARADLVVMITWNTDNTDVDLHVTEPSGEECFYSHRQTRSGGELTRDVTQGYGPEMFVLKSAPSGKYRITAHYYASDRNRASARTKVYATVFEDWGTSKERVSEKVVALEYGKQEHELAIVKR